MAPIAVRAQEGGPSLPPAVYPDLPARAAGAEGFVPPGWALEDRATGDLNGDGQPDLLLVLRARDPANVLNNPGLGERRFDTNPRILAVAFAGPEGYRLALQDHGLIPRRADPRLDDPFEAGDLQVARGTIRLSLGRWASAGSYAMERRSFTFRRQEGRFALIGFDAVETDRASGAVRETSVNFSIGQAVIGLGRVEDDRKRERRLTLPRRRPPALEEIGDGLAFDPGLPR
jgi:hypothetical protein